MPDEKSCDWSHEIMVNCDVICVVERKVWYVFPSPSDHVYLQARTQEFSQGGASFRAKRWKFFLSPPLAFKMLLFYIKSTTCPLGGPFSIQGLYITMYPSV